MPTAYANPSYDGFVRKYGGAFSGLCTTGSVTGNDAGPSSANDHAASAEPSNPMVYRGFWQFLASDFSLPAGAVVTGARIGLWVYAKSAAGGGTTANNSVAIVESLIPDDTAPAVGHYGNVGSTELSNRIDLSTLTTGAYKEVDLNAAGISLVNAKIAGTGRIKLALRIGHDLDVHTPTAAAYWQSYWADQTGTTNDPYLVLDYVIAKTGSDSVTATEGGSSVTPTVAVTASDSAAASDSASVVVPILLQGTPTNGLADDFTGTASVPIESRSPTGTNARGSWTRVRGSSAFIQLFLDGSGRAYHKGDSGGLSSTDYKAMPDTFTDGYMEAGLYIASATSDYMAIAVRHNDATGASSTYYMVLIDNGLLGHRGRLTLTRVVLGASTDLGFYDIPGFANGNSYAVRLEATGTSLTVKLDGSSVITATDSSITAAGYPWLLTSGAINAGSGTGIQFDYIDSGTAGASRVPSDSATTTDTASRSTASTPVSANDSGSATDTASVGAVSTQISASDSSTATDSSSATRFVNTVPGSPQTRAASGSPVTLFPSNGSAGTYGSHYGLPDGIMLPDGTLMVVARKSGGHSVFSGSARGRIVAKTKPPGGSWSAEATILDTAYDERDPCLGLLADGTVCLTWNRLDLDGKAYNGDNGDTKFYAPFMKCPAGSDPLVAANWTTPVHITGTGLANNWRVGTDILELTPGGRIVVALYGTPTYPPWVDDECWIGYSDDGGTTWGMLSMLDNGNTHALSSSGEAQLVRCGDGSVLACYRTIASPWETWARRSTDNCATWSSEWRIATNSINKTGMVRTPDGDVIIAFNNGSEQLTIAQSFDEGATFTTTVLGNTGNLYAQPFYFGTQGVGPNAAVVYAYETSGQTIASVYYQELTAGATPAVSLNDTATATDAGSVTVGVGAIAKTATDSATTTDTGNRSAVTRYITAIDSAVVLDSSGTDTNVKLPVRILRDTYVTSEQFGSKTVSSATFGDRTTYVHPESEIKFA